MIEPTSCDGCGRDTTNPDNLCRRCRTKKRRAYWDVYDEIDGKPDRHRRIKVRKKDTQPDDID